MTLAAGEVNSGGFVRNAEGALVAAAEGTVNSGGFVRDADGRVVLAGSPNWAKGDNVTIYAAGVEGQTLQIKVGTAAAPLTKVGPVAKFNRTGAVTLAAIEAKGGAGTDGSDQLAAVMGVSRGTAAEEVQGIGVSGFAYTESTVDTKYNDALGLCGLGWAKSGSVGSLGCGVSVVGRSESATGKTSGIEAQSYIAGSAVEETFSASAAATNKGVFVSAGGEKDSGVAVQIANPAGRQFAYGIHANAQVNNEKTGGVKLAFIRDDSTAERSILIKGTHSKAALAVGSGSGSIIVGAEEPANASALLELIAKEETTDPLYVFGGTKIGRFRGYLIRNNNATLAAVACVGANDFMTGTANGDSGLACTQGKIMHLGAAGKTSVVRVSETGVAFNGATPVAKAGAITTPAETVAALKTAVDAIRVALTNVGITA